MAFECIMQFEADQHCNLKLHTDFSKGKVVTITTLTTVLYSRIVYKM